MKRIARAQSRTWAPWRISGTAQAEFWIGPQPVRAKNADGQVNLPNADVRDTRDYPGLNPEHVLKKNREAVTNRTNPAPTHSKAGFFRPAIWNRLKPRWGPSDLAPSGDGSVNTAAAAAVQTALSIKSS